jgi:hypothetical protein
VRGCHCSSGTPPPLSRAYERHLTTTMWLGGCSALCGARTNYVVVCLSCQVMLPWQLSALCVLAGHTYAPWPLSGFGRIPAERRNVV